LPGRLESDILGREEKIDNARPQVVNTPSQPGMNRRNEIQANGEQNQYYQAKQDLYNSGDSFQHGQDYTAIWEKSDSHQSDRLIDNESGASLRGRRIKKQAPAIFGMRGVLFHP